MSDLKEELEKLFRDAFNSDSKVRELYGKIRQGNATHKDALRFAERVGQLAAGTFRENTSEEMFGSAEMRKEMVDSIMGLLRLDHEIVTEVTTIVQENLNKQAGIGLKAVEPKMDLERAQGLSQYVAEQENRDKAAAKMDSGAVNFSQHTVDEHLKQNARFQWKAGMSPKILRTAEAGACKWCKALAGVYDYGDVKDTGNDVFRRHENCNCVVEYIADGKKAQDVWSKATYRRDDPEDRVITIKKLEEAWKKRQEDQLKQRAARAEAVSKIQSELGYSAKGAAIWYNQNKGYIDRYGLDYVLEVSRQTLPRPLSGDNIGNSIKKKTPEQRVIEADIKGKNEKRLIQDIEENHYGLAGNDPKGWKRVFESAGYATQPLHKGTFKDVSFEKGGGYKVVIEYDGGYFQFHPENGRYHEGAYYKISSGKTGTIRYNLDGSIKND